MSKRDGFMMRLNIFDECFFCLEEFLISLYISEQRFYSKRFFSAVIFCENLFTWLFCAGMVRDE